MVRAWSRVFVLIDGRHLQSVRLRAGGRGLRSLIGRGVPRRQAPLARWPVATTAPTSGSGMSTVLSAASRQGAVRRRVIGIYSLLATFNIGAWVWAFIAF